jgi:hypothetical protein
VNSPGSSNCESLTLLKVGRSRSPRLAGAPSTSTTVIPDDNPRVTLQTSSGGACERSCARR